MFTDDDLEGVQTPHNNALVVTTIVGGIEVQRFLVDMGASYDILYNSTFEKIGLKTSQLDPCPSLIIRL